MNSALTNPASAVVDSGAESARQLPSGRSVVVRVNDSKEELEVRSPQGEVEVRITLTESGPVVSLRGARLELESPDAVSVKCKSFEVTTTEGTSLHSTGDVTITGHEMKVKTEADIHMNGGVIRLNC